MQCIMVKEIVHILSSALIVGKLHLNYRLYSSSYNPFVLPNLEITIELRFS